MMLPIGQTRFALGRSVTAESPTQNGSAGAVRRRARHLGGPARQRDLGVRIVARERPGPEEEPGVPTDHGEGREPRRERVSAHLGVVHEGEERRRKVRVESDPEKQHGEEYREDHGERWGDPTRECRRRGPPGGRRRAGRELVDDDDAEDCSRALLRQDAEAARERQAGEPEDGVRAALAPAPHPDERPAEDRERREEIGPSDDVRHRLGRDRMAREERGRREGRTRTPHRHEPEEED
jgi:hypothetical protein